MRKKYKPAIAFLWQNIRKPQWRCRTFAASKNTHQASKRDAPRCKRQRTKVHKKGSRMSFVVKESGSMKKRSPERRETLGTTNLLAAVRLGDVDVA